MQRKYTNNKLLLATVDKVIYTMVFQPHENIEYAKNTVRHYYKEDVKKFTTLKIPAKNIRFRGAA